MRTTLAAILLVLLALASPAAADDAPPVHLQITGAIDAGVLATSIAAELGRPVAAAGETCAAPCLSVVVAEGQATVAFTSADAATRTRSVPLGADRSQWTVVVTLLAGNLVRDEASDLLGALPDKPAPVSPPPAGAPADVLPTPAAPGAPALIAEPVEQGRAASVAIGLFPLVSTDGTDLERCHFLSLDLIAGVHGGISGVAIAGIADVERGVVRGGQVAGIAAVAGEVNGVQVAGTAAVAGRTTGMQLAGIATYANGNAATQGAGIAAVSLGTAAIQIAGVAAYAERDGYLQAAGIAVHAGRNGGIQIGGISASAERASHVQIGGIATYAGWSSDVQVGGIAAVTDGRAGAQVGGVVSYAESADVQVAGLVNVTDRLAGLQIAPINVASRNDGMQLGVINIGGGPDGDSFGIINIVPGGRYDVEGSVDNDRLGTLLLRHGGRHWHNVYGVGGQSTNQPAGARNDDVWMYGAGFGPTFRLGGSVLDLEAIAWEVNHGARHERDLSLLAQARATLGIPLGFITLVAGAAANTYISDDPTSPFIVARTTMPTGQMSSSDVKVTLWPSLFVGVRL